MTGTEMAGTFFTLVVDSPKGVFSVLRTDGTALLQNATALVHTDTGSFSLASFSTATATAGRFADAAGRGRSLEIVFEDAAQGLEVGLTFVLYDALAAVSIELTCCNRSSGDRFVYGLEPVRAMPDSGASLFVPGVCTCLTNGAMYYDAGRLHLFGTPFAKSQPYGETKGGKTLTSAVPAIGETVDSWWNAGLFSGYGQQGLVVGYVENTSGFGRLLFCRTRPGQIGVVAESVHNPGLVLKPGQGLRSNRLAIVVGADPYAALESYAALAGAIGKARTHSIINGWCPWFYARDTIGEDEILRHARFVAEHLKPYGMDHIQVDEGYQRCHGQWQGNERFPHGMQWLADQIRGYGLKAGIWVAPYVISEDADVFINHPDWLLKNADGSLRRVGPWPDENSDWANNETPKRYGLDITHPDAACWLHDLMDTIANRWGYEMVKIDFVAWSLLSAHHFADPAVTPVAAYHRGYQIMRAAVGPRCHLLECGPGAVSVGLIDSMRIELDQNYGNADDAWKQYFADSSSSAAAAAKRYYFHQKTWVNDADHLCLNLLSLPQARAAATLIGLSGGNVISGDRLIDLDPAKRAIVGKVLPAYGQAARPVDLLDTDQPAVFALRVEKPFGHWTVAGFFNADRIKPRSCRYRLERLWLKPAATYLVYDFWQERFIGEICGHIAVVVPPGSVTLVALHEKSGLPQVVSTSRHVLQGAVELEDVAWDPVTATLSAVSVGPPHSSHDVAVYLPRPKAGSQGRPVLDCDDRSCRFHRVDQHIVRVMLFFDENPRIAWRIGPDAI